MVSCKAWSLGYKMKKCWTCNSRSTLVNRRSIMRLQTRWNFSSFSTTKPLWNYIISSNSYYALFWSRQCTYSSALVKKPAGRVTQLTLVPTQITPSILPASLERLLGVRVCGGGGGDEDAWTLYCCGTWNRSQCFCLILCVLWEKRKWYARYFSPSNGNTKMNWAFWFCMVFLQEMIYYELSLQIYVITLSENSIHVRKEIDRIYLFLYHGYV